MVSTAGVAPATSTFARWRSDLTELRGQMASVIGLAPIAPTQPEGSLGFRDRGIVWVHCSAARWQRAVDVAMPKDLERNIALRGLIVDKNLHVVATVWREGHFEPYPPASPELS